MWMEELKHTDPEVQARAAYHVYAANPELVRGEAGAREGLERLILSGFPSPAAILLSTHVPSPALRAHLRAMEVERGTDMVKLYPWSLPVAMRWPLALALSRMGDHEARVRLLEWIGAASLAERLLVLDAIQSIDDPTVLQQVSGYLEDGREIDRGVPSGAIPRRRLQDFAVDQLVGRLRLPATFQLNPHGRYTEKEIQETGRLLRGTIPS
jgi:hypothetical protein